MFSNTYKYRNEAKKNKLSFQDEAVVQEFERALTLGATKLAKTIYSVNSDLKEALDKILVKHKVSG